MDPIFDDTQVFGLNTWISPEIEVPQIQTTDIGTGMLDGLFDKAGGLQGIASIAGAIGGIMSGMDQRDYQKELLKMEKERIKRDRARQEKFEGDMKSAWN